MFPSVFRLKQSQPEYVKNEAASVFVLVVTQWLSVCFYSSPLIGRLPFPVRLTGAVVVFEDPPPSIQTPQGNSVLGSFTVRTKWAIPRCQNKGSLQTAWPQSRHQTPAASLRLGTQTSLDKTISWPDRPARQSLQAWSVFDFFFFFGPGSEFWIVSFPNTTMWYWLNFSVVV